MENNNFVNQEIISSPEHSYTFCCPNIKLNYPYTSDGSFCAMNEYFQEFQAYINNHSISLSPPISASIFPEHYFEVVIKRYTRWMNKLGQKYARRETTARWFVPLEDKFQEVARDTLPAGDQEPPGFPVEQMWTCAETTRHSTQLFVRLHHRHYSKGAEQMAEIAQWKEIEQMVEIYQRKETEQMVEIDQRKEAGCLICNAQVEHERLRDETYALLDLHKWTGPGGGGLGPEFTWEGGILINMGLNGDEPILDHVDGEE
jgi:hypothetical protein